jgi:YaiO family outer membrane protein
MLRAALALVVALAAATGFADAACSLREQPTKRVDLESGVSNDTLTQNRGNWDEQYVTLVDRDGNARSAYVRAADDTRFNQSDPSYEAGTYVSVDPKLILNAIANFSPTHQVLPDSTLQGGLDARTGGGYGYQLEYGQRNFTASTADIGTIGADRYFGVDRIAATVSLARLSGVPGLAMSEGVTFARYLPCDGLSFSTSTGRDVESTGVGANLAVYHAISYDVNDVHWFTPHLALNVGMGWYLLVGAYDRFEIRIALHERL